jgi:hypothetical protein
LLQEAADSSTGTVLRRQWRDNQLVNEANTQQNVARQILSLNHIGDIYRAQGRLLESKKVGHHMQALNLCDQISKLASKLTTLRYLMRTHLADLDYSSAQSLLHEVYELRSRRKVSTVRDLYRSHVHEYRLLFNSDVSKALTELTLVAENIERINDRLWFGSNCPQ